MPSLVAFFLLALSSLSIALPPPASRSPLPAGCAPAGSGTQRLTPNTSDHARAPALRKGREGEKAAEQHRCEGRAKRRRFERPLKVAPTSVFLPLPFACLPHPPPSFLFRPVAACPARSCPITQESVSVQATSAGCQRPRPLNRFSRAASRLLRLGAPLQKVNPKMYIEVAKGHRQVNLLPTAATPATAGGL